ncbi:hypothetical protein G8O24_00985 [Bradyrhizobium sp. INPA01-394B]|uniref:Uncharacterized protein n=1 Tax=Bradyrhizobium campsiandrae TaxID=1729892 RepID=A0ABR7TYT3_9BRAD|nr:hypothetical protein [Bradyrhizobium campsiandrae]MBC9875919.1 hypothetical protein [Bradyrhizobium campsiandrae]MBC9976972.1 hypothetical protein [Bradyrhizobium campsiandrae]
MEREINPLSCDELEMISGGEPNLLLQIHIPGFDFKYYDTGSGIGYSWGHVCATNGSSIRCD